MKPAVVTLNMAGILALSSVKSEAFFQLMRLLLYSGGWLLMLEKAFRFCCTVR